MRCSIQRVPRTMMRRRGLSALALLALLALLLTACAQLTPWRPPAAHNVTPTSAIVVTRTASRMAADDSSKVGDHPLSVTVSCRPGEQMLAGGYAAIAVFESDYHVLAFYPAADDAWSVVTTSGSSYQLQAMVYCLTASSSLGIRALQAATCSAGMTRLACGVKDANPVSGNAGTPYVLCAARGVIPTTHGIRVGATELDCASHTTGGAQSESRTFSYTCATLVVSP